MHAGQSKQAAIGPMSIPSLLVGTAVVAMGAEEDQDRAVALAMALAFEV